MLEAINDATRRTPQRVPDLLTPEGVQAFLENPSPEARAEAAAVIAKEFAEGGFSETEVELAVAILDSLVTEAETLVREALAEHLNDCPELPAPLAKKMAEDESDSVSIPLLRCSPVLEDEYLISIALRGEIPKQVALAKRVQVSPELAEALVRSRHEKVVGALLGNKGADLPEPLLNLIIDEFGSFTAFHSLFVERPFLPLSVVLRMFLVLPDDLKERLLERHELPAKFIHHLSRLSRENSIDLSANKSDTKPPKAPNIFKLIQGLEQKDELPTTVVLRALLAGDLSFFEAAMADRVQMGLDATRSLIYSASPKGFKGLYGRSGMPEEFMRAFRIGIDYVIEIGRDKAAYWRGDYTEESIKRLSAEFDEFCPAELRRLIGRLQRRFVNQADQNKRGSVELAFSKGGSKGDGSKSGGREKRSSEASAGRKGPLRPAG